MKKTWISLRVIEGEHENSDAACEAMLDGCGGNFDETHPLCDVILGLTPSEIRHLLKRTLNQEIEEQQ